MSWEPNPQSLQQLKLIITGTLSPDNQERNNANEALAQARLQPEVENYLFHILVMDNSTSSHIRASAGIMLKNSVLKSAIDRPYILDHIIEGLLVDDTGVRNITGNVITSLFSIYGLHKWPQALAQLIDICRAPEPPYKTQEAAMSAMAKICEDSYYKLGADPRAIEFLMTNFLELMGHPQSGKIKSLSIECINYFIPLNNDFIVGALDVFLNRMFDMANDANNNVKINICKAFTLLLDNNFDKLRPHLHGVIDYCLHLINDHNEDISLEACEFLLALATCPEAENDNGIFANKLDMILPVLLEKMVYSEEEIILMSMVDEQDNADVADNEENIKPINAKSKDSHKVSSTRKTKRFDEDDDNDDSDFDDDDDDDDDDLLLDQWSIRKCSAATLDILSLNMPEKVLDGVLPLLHSKIVSDVWQVREAAILAFGAISKSCIELAGDKLPELVPFLVDRLKDQEPRVRQITCWTISRYSGWVAEEAHEGGKYANYFDPTFRSILNCCLDQKKVVQESACSALSSFIESSDSDLIAHYLEDLLQHFTKCFEMYQRKNLIMLYDCLQTFIESMGYSRLSANQQYIDTLLPPLLTRWQLLDDNDNALWPLLECMASIAATLCELFAPYAVPVYERAVKILSNCIQLELQCQTNPNLDVPEKDFMVTSLDLIDGLIQGFGIHSIELINTNNTNLVELVLQCFEDNNNDVKQSAYALLGDMAIFILASMEPYLNKIMHCLGNELNNRDYNAYAVYNNAIWALGEMMMRLSYDKIQPYIENFLSLLIPILTSVDTHQAVLENAAICIGRMGLNGGAVVISPRLPEFILQWCSQMLYLIDNDEKETAFNGMLNIINGNPEQGFGGLNTSQGQKNLAIFISTIANYLEPPDDLRHLFLQLLNGYKQLLGETVFNNKVLCHLDGDSRHQLVKMYGI